MHTKNHDLTFEAALQQLEQTVTGLEKGDLTLEESLTLFEKGKQLVAHCRRHLDQATLRVEQLMEDGEIVEIEA